MCKRGKDKPVKLCRPTAYSVKNEVKVDACLQKLVQVLNDYGIETIACCCGHGKTHTSGIRIHPRHIELLPLGDSLTVHLKFPYPDRKETPSENQEYIPPDFRWIYKDKKEES